MYIECTFLQVILGVPKQLQPKRYAQNTKQLHSVVFMYYSMAIFALLNVLLGVYC